MRQGLRQKSIHGRFLFLVGIGLRILGSRSKQSVVSTRLHQLFICKEFQASRHVKMFR